MIHKILGRLASARSFVFAALALALSTMSASAENGFIADDPPESTKSWAVTVECQTAEGLFQRKCEQLDEYSYTLRDSWYCVQGNVTIGTLTVNGKASLVLCDGATLTVGSDWDPGIQLTQGNTLTIYGQSGGTGVLIANGGSSCAGIGGGMMMDAQLCGKLNIYGGNITATSAEWGSAIGSTSTDYDSTGQIYIYGGSVTATGADYFGGIGGYKWNDQGTLIVGANMTVTAGADAASAVELTPGVDGSVTLSAQKYFHIESAADVPLEQIQSEFTKTVGDTITLSSTIRGGKKPYVFSGAVPAGLTLSDGTLTCVIAGEYNFSLTVTDDESTVINATYALTVERVEKTITYIDGTDGETVLAGLTPIEYTPGGSTVYLPNYLAVTNKVGYRFLNWYPTPRLDLDGDSPVYGIYSSDKGNKIFYAKFVLQDYIIYYYDYVDGSLTTLNTGSYTINDTPVTLWTPAAKEGYTFAGWCYESDCSDTPIFTLPKDTTDTQRLYAKWTENGSGGGGDEPGDGTVLVSFVDASGSPMQQVCTPVTSETTTLTNGGWYVVNDDVNRSGNITVEGSASLVLVNGKTLTVSDVESFKAGITVADGCAFTVYGQAGNTGVLNVTGGSNSSGIGGEAVISGSAVTCGTITINGGTVNATGGNYAAGIGGAYNCNCGNVTINGGIVNAEGTGYGSGIGGGARSSGGAVTINGGSVTAESGISGRAGIGSGYTWGDVEVSNGTLWVAPGLNVYAGADEQNTELRTADSATHLVAVDDGWHYFQISGTAEPVATFSNIVYHESDGTIITDLTPATYEEGVGVSLDTAVPPSKAGYTFAYWYEYGAEDVPVTAVPASATGDRHFYAKWVGKTCNIRYFVEGVEDTSLTPKTYTVGTPVNLPYSPRKDFYIFDFWCDNPELIGDSISVLRDTTEDVVLYARFKPQNFSITYYDGSQELSLDPPSYTIESATITLPTPSKAGYVFAGWYANSELTGSTVTTIPAGSTGVKNFYADWTDEPPAVISVTAKAADGSDLPAHDCKVLSAGVTTLDNDWYVLSDDVDYGTSGITVSGDVTLVLMDGKTLTVTGKYRDGDYLAGINVPQGSSLAIYVGGAAGTGKIVATGASFAAGIGGNGGISEDAKGNSGSVIINGGVIEATGGSNSPGIGAGYGGTCGAITINNGTITACGTSGGSGIGGASFKAGGTVTVNGGRVTATGSVYSDSYIGAGIGGGIFSSDHGTLTIGSNLTVKSGDTEEAMTVIASSAGSVTLDGKQYYAIIPLEEFGITYMDGASTLNLAPAKYTAGQVCALPVPTKSGYTFAGWYTKSDFSSLPVSEIPAEATGTQTFYSMWVEGNVGGVPEFTIDEHGKLTAANLKGNPEVTIPDVVTEIDRNVFKDVTTLKNVTILGNVKKIGNYAFQGCTGLESVTFGNGVEVIGDLSFDGCTALESVTFGNTIETIGEAAFQNTPALTSSEGGLYFPDSVTSIGRNAFYNTGLAKASLPGGLYSEGSPLSSDFENVTIGKKTELVYRTNAVVFYISGGDLTAVDPKANTTITIPNTVTRIFPGVFEGCTQIETVTIPSSVENIQMQAFKGCTSLTAVSLPDSVVYLGDYAFQGCTALETVTIGNGVASIPTYAFDGCTALETVTIGSGARSIMTHAFSGCEALAGIEIPDGVTTLQAYAFFGCTSLQSAVIGNGITSLEGHVFGGCTALSSVAIGNGVTTIKSFAFSGCSSLAALTIPANVTTIEAYAFSEAGLVDIVIPDTVTTLGAHAFYGCYSLENVTLGSGITSIGDGMFFGLTALESVTLRGNVTSIGENAFFNCTSLATFNFPSTITSVGEDAFWKCRAMEIEVRFPENSTIGRFAFFSSGITYVFVDKGGQVGSLAFAECKNLARAIIADKESTSGSKLLLSTKGRRLLGAKSEDATGIADHAFFGCSDLESVALGKSVDSVGQGAFSGCPKLATFNVDPENDNYKSENGMLLTKDGATLISAFGEETSVTVPEGVVTVSGSAFAGNTTLQSVVLPSGVTTIGEAAFSNATAFATITIPSTVTSIGANAFMDTVLATVNVEKDDTARVKTLVEATGYTGMVSYVESGSEPATEWPADTSTVEGQTAAEAFDITGDLATADAKKLADWAKAKGVDFGGTIITDAYLLNCANTAEAVATEIEAAKEAIKITAITFDSEGNPVLTCPEAYGNGKVEVQGSINIGASAEWHTKQTGDKFFRTKLVP